MDWPRRGRRDDAFESGGAMTANIELVTGRNTLQRLPRLPGAAAEELDRVLAHDPLDHRDVWAQALPQPAPRELYTFSFTMDVDSTWQPTVNWLESATQAWARVPQRLWAQVIATLLSLLARDCRPLTAHDEEVMSQVEWRSLRVRPGVMEARSWDNHMKIIFMFRIERNWAHVVAREAPTVRFVDIEYKGHVQFIPRQDDGELEETSDSRD